MSYDYDIVILGGGSGGLVVASAAANLGARVALVESHKMGGDCLNFGCIPSKTFLKSAHLAAEIRQSEAFGLTAKLESIDLAKIMRRVQSVIDEIAPHDSVARFESLGVDVFQSIGRLLDKHTVLLGAERKVSGKYIVIATGSEPRLPAIPGLDNVPYLTNKTIFQLKRCPKQLIILGGGPIGLELGQGFLHLGSNVTVIDCAPTLFGKDEPEVSALMQTHFLNEGMVLNLSAEIERVDMCGNQIQVTIKKEGAVTKVTGDALLVSLGRQPVTRGLNLEAVGVKVMNNGYIWTNKRLQTSVSSIYACGDVVGPYQFTHMAGYQAGIIVRNSLLKLRAAVDYSCVPWTTFTQPEVAHVGYTQKWAEEESIFLDSIHIDLKKMDRAKTDGEVAGFLKLILNKKAVIIGATLVGKKAGEMIPMASLAIRQKMKPKAFVSQIFAYPTQSEIYKFAGLEQLKKGFKPWMKQVIKLLK